MLCRVTRLLVSMAVVMLLITLTASAQDDYVAAGTDYLHTGPGTGVDLSQYGFPANTLFQGNANPAFCGGCADTIIQRQQDADITNPLAIPIRVLYVSMCFQDPTGHTIPCYSLLNANGFHYMGNLVLAGREQANNTGTMTITGNTAGGTFDSSFTVNALVTFTPTDGGPPIGPAAVTTTLTSNGSAWTSTQPINTYSLIAPYPAQQANVHTGLPQPPQGVRTDFFIVTFVREIHPFGRGALHVAGPACIVIPIALVRANVFWWICIAPGDAPSAGKENVSLDQIGDAMLRFQDLGPTDSANLAGKMAQ
jgi:hypothetical protein